MVKRRSRLCSKTNVKSLFYLIQLKALFPILCIGTCWLFCIAGEFCEDIVDVCSNELDPCQNEAKCVSSTDPEVFRCECHYGFSGQLCEKKAVGFVSDSFIQLPTIFNQEYQNERKEFSVRITFATLSLSSLLVIDYNSLSSDTGKFTLDFS